eukprot:CAMPEP_0167748188 /NCGR_PEP_ID=MMETSP0110_2-20121227/4702_1 /TAXON_ID=629695 /ORGANISM="Gymnochlora sp., Strain CCMP2014" /LENGTH=438 /DNA_ID=CAMNT_0007633181 /DNA_START=239 /DNA_END=1555 /DNA_ORIENTATION=-
MKKEALKRELADIERELDPLPEVISEALPCDYGYLAKTAGRYFDLNGPGGPPGGAIKMARENFAREFQEMIKFFQGKGDIEDADDCIVDPDDPEKCLSYRQMLKNLTLSNDAVWARERNRPEIQAPFIIKGPYFILCYMLDVLFDGKPLERFWFLETVARMPYLSYVTMLHLYESFGWWRRAAAVKRIHFAEEWNEFHHLLIFESLGGDRGWLTRFFAQHAAIVYYWVLVVLWLLSPTLAYNFSELIEAHAVDTYGEFADANEDLMKQLPPPAIALQYYMGGDMYLYDEFQSERQLGNERRPNITNLHDVICTIRDDEAEHVATMAACQKSDAIVRSINIERGLIIAGVTYLITNQLFSSPESPEISALADAVPEGFLALPLLGPLFAKVGQLREALPETWTEQLPMALREVFPTFPDAVIDALVLLITRIGFLLDLL